MRHGREPSVAIRMESCPMRRLTSIILPVSLAFASGAFASSSATADRSPSSPAVGTSMLERSEAPPRRAQARTFTPEQARRIAGQLDRMSPRMRQALLGRLAKMSDDHDGERRVRRAGPTTNRAGENGERRELRDRRSRRGADRGNAVTPMRGKADGRRDGRRVRPDHDRRDREGVRGSKQNRGSAKRNARNEARERDEVRRVRSGKRAQGATRRNDEVRRARDNGPRLRRAGDAGPEASNRKRSSPSEGRRRD
ncbi:MAG TPA: hypothetical protein DCG14_09930 [Phycisphaerales bacterium]|nr:hypothetical protein [Phycisphaerales bacterium]